MVNFNNFGGLKFVLKFYIFIFLTCKELVRIRLICEELVRFFPDVKNRYSILHTVASDLGLRCLSMSHKMTLGLYGLICKYVLGAH